ncbi:hypothetical protein C9374_001949 [Naegleria lovaniensis]|uniref:Tr-type G domain-containing protein n=1 Tax=Naegleria lovaniensis TaxID=51637 RepID=A0AA88GWA0_NAELO|nr:uncharacterized protein C9374_001949 [Naegleria lovaniensis]KAG2386914.1 hypothetical protein C9374_001949 [Naegleria lovaniensis]
MQQNEKHFTQKNILFMGSPNSGKSTLCGCLVCHDDMRYVELTANRLFQDVEEHLRPSKQLQILEAYRHCSHKTNYPERARKIQIAIHHKSDENKKEILTFMDVSTRKKKIDCFIKACFLADIAALVIDVTENIFEKEIENFDSTLNNQLRIAKSVGIPHMIVCLNMCDKAQQLHSRFKEIVSCLDPKLRKLGWKNVPYIPVSSVDFGLNILHNSGIFSFYKGESLWNTLKTLEISKDSLKLQDKPLKMAAVDVFRIGGVGTVIIARIESGILREADIIEVYPKPNKSGLSNLWKLHSILSSMPLLEILLGSH